MRINKAHTKLIPNKKDELFSTTANDGIFEGTTFNGTASLLLRYDLEMFKVSHVSEFKKMNTKLLDIDEIAAKEHCKPIRTYRDCIQPELSAFELTIGDEVTLIDANYASLILKHDFTLTEACTPYLYYGIFKGDQFVGLVSGVSLPDSILKVREEASNYTIPSKLRKV